MDYPHEELTRKIIACFYKVNKTLGDGFLEKVYHNALLHELQKNGLNCFSQFPIKVYYDDVMVGEYYADIVVEDTVILELKVVSELLYEHECQLINYLRASGYEIGLLINFGKNSAVKRKIFSHKTESK